MEQAETSMKTNHLSSYWTPDEDALLLEGANDLHLDDAEITILLMNNGYNRTMGAVRDRLNRLRRAKETGAKIRYHNDESPKKSEAEVLAANKPWKPLMRTTKPKYIRLYQIFDEDDPVATDNFFKTREEAERFGRDELTKPSEIIEHRIGTTKDDIIFALMMFPKRGSSL